MGAPSGTEGVRPFGDGVRGVRGAARTPASLEARDELSVEAHTRFDAIELLRRLHALRTAQTYMLQTSGDRWLVCARPHARDDAVDAQLAAAVDAWRGERGLVAEPI
jgi:hypothetical protein